MKSGKNEKRIRSFHKFSLHKIKQAKEKLHSEFTNVRDKHMFPALK